MEFQFDYIYIYSYTYLALHTNLYEIQDTFFTFYKMVLIQGSHGVYGPRISRQN